MNIYKPEHVLEFWQAVYGELNKNRHKEFLEHRAMEEILRASSDDIKVAIRRNQNLDDVLEDLRNQWDKLKLFMEKHPRLGPDRWAD